LDLIIDSPGPHSIMLVPSITWCHFGDLEAVELVWQLVLPMVGATASSPFSTRSTCGL
jgi:hypothetical protein